MKRCACCLTDQPDDSLTCANCGEASFEPAAEEKSERETEPELDDPEGPAAEEKAARKSRGPRAR